MIRLIILTLISTMALWYTSYSQDFYTLTSKLFFNVDTKHSDSILLSEFNKNPELMLKKDSGWTAYSVLDDKGNSIPYHSFSFSKHPYFAKDFYKGQLILITTNTSERIIGMMLSISFNSVDNFNSTYKSVIKSYRKYSSKTIKRPNIAAPFEVTKYLSEKGNDYVIITKGESGKKPYIHFAYNYQIYNW